MYLFLFTPSPKPKSLGSFLVLGFLFFTVWNILVYYLCLFVLLVTSLSLCLSVSVFQVSFICVRVFAACRRTEISTDLPVRGKTFLQFDFLCLERECESPSIVWPGMEFTLQVVLDSSSCWTILLKALHVEICDNINTLMSQDLNNTAAMFFWLFINLGQCKHGVSWAT